MTAADQGAGSGQAPADMTATHPVPSDPVELERDIERTRERLGETVEALAAKADLKTRAKEKAGEISGQLKSKGAALSGRVESTVRSRPGPIAAVSAAAAAVLFAIGWRRGHG